MVDWTAGLLGGVAGAGTAVADIAADKRKMLAEKLKAEALETLRAGNDAAITDKKIASDEKIASERNTLIQKMADEENQLKRDLANVDKGSAKASVLKTKADAASKAMKAYQDTGDITQANIIRESADLPPLEEYVVEPGKDRTWPDSDVPEKRGVRVQGSGGLLNPGGVGGGSGGGGSALQQELDSLLNEGKGMMAPQDRKGADLQSVSYDGDSAIAPAASENPKNKVSSGNKFADQWSGHKIESPRVKDGVVWAYVDGTATRLAVEPPKRIYNNQYDNPEYAQYVEFLKKLGL